MTEQAYNSSEILEASFRFEETTNGDDPARNLYLKTYKLVDENASVWHARPDAEWPLIATIMRNRIVMYSCHANPHAKRYMSQKNGRFGMIVFEDDGQDELPNDVEAAVLGIEVRLGWGLFDSPAQGLGLRKELEAVWLGLSRLPGVNVLVVTRRSNMHVDGFSVYISAGELDRLRRAFNRTRTNGRKLIREVNQGIVHDEALTKLDPVRFQRIVRVNPPLVEVAREGSKGAATREREVRKSQVQSVRKQLGEISEESPHELMMLHAEIERVTLTAMIEKFRNMLLKPHSETQWQRFFERNKLVLSMAFARPVELAHTQFHAQGSGLTGSGAQIGDFLFTEQGQSLAIVEIKTPDTKLLQTTPYRKPHVFGPHPELSGAVTQVLHQQSELHTRWAQHTMDTPSLRERRPDVIKCVVIAGTRPSDEYQLRSFEVFRNACKDVEVITFTELLGKLELLQKHLAPPAPPLPGDVPF